MFFLKATIAVGLGLALAVMTAEAALRVYHPFQLRLKGNSIQLTPNLQYRVGNHDITGLDRIIHRSTNSIGFRGPNPPDDFSDRLSLVAIGGSTTECAYLSDGQDWPALLSGRLHQHFSYLWVNNAGLDGHSTFGHHVLVQDYILKLKPRVVLFLVGANDMGLLRENSYDRREEIDRWTIRAILRGAADGSETVNLLRNLYRGWEARRQGLGHRSVDFRRAQLIDVKPEDEAAILRSHAEALRAFERRLDGLVQTLSEAGILPILLTQPTLMGGGVDHASQVDSDRVAVPVALADRPTNGKVYKRVLEAYNDVTRRYAERRKIQLIDLARMMPASPDYFYDHLHYTVKGAEQVAQIVYREVCAPLQQAFLSFGTSPCPQPS